MTDNRLNDQSRHRRRNPQDRNIIDLRAKGLKNPADIGILQSKAELDAEKSKTHIPDLPEMQPGFFHVDLFLFV